MTSTRISSEVSSSSIDNEKQIKTVLNVVLVLLMVASLLMAVKNGILWFNEKASIMSVIVPLGLLVLFSLVWGMIPSNKDKTKKK